MTDRAINMKAHDVRALLAGTKVQHRVVVKPQPYVDAQGNACWNGGNFGQDGRGPLFSALASPIPSSRTKRVHCQYGRPGDRLWVREAWRVSRQHDHKAPRDLPERKMTVFFDAGGSIANQASGRWERDDAYTYSAEHMDWVGKVRPSIHMPRWASRITLDITEVRVERLRDISNEDARAEGVLPQYADECAKLGHPYSAIPLFRAQWAMTNGPGSWDANPWVWVICFKQVGGTHGS